MADGAPMQPRKRRLPGSMQPKAPATEPETPAKSKKKKVSEAPSTDIKKPKQVQTRLSFDKKPLQDRSTAFAVKPESPKLPMSAAPRIASPVRCSPQTMLAVTDEKLLGQCRPWLKSSASQAVSADKHEADNAIATRAVQAVRVEQHVAAEVTAGHAGPSREAVPSGGGPEDEERGRADPKAEPGPPAQNDFCRNLLEDLLGGTLPSLSTASAAVRGQPHDRLAPEAGPSNINVSKSEEAHVSGSLRGASGGHSRSRISVVEEGGKLSDATDGQADQGRTVLPTQIVPTQDVGPQLPFSASAGSLRAGGSKKLSMRERMNLIQSQ